MAFVSETETVSLEGCLESVGVIDEKDVVIDMEFE